MWELQYTINHKQGLKLSWGLRGTSNVNLTLFPRKIARIVPTKFTPIISPNTLEHFFFICGQRTLILFLLRNGVKILMFFFKYTKFHDDETYSTATSGPRASRYTITGWSTVYYQMLSTHGSQPAPAMQVYRMQWPIRTLQFEALPHSSFFVF
jgi:hypothetical protein